jgi:hypothetical protein
MTHAVCRCCDTGDAPVPRLHTTCWSTQYLRFCVSGSYLQPRSPPRFRSTRRLADDSGLERRHWRAIPSEGSGSSNSEPNPFQSKYRTINHWRSSIFWRGIHCCDSETGADPYAQSLLRGTAVRSTRSRMHSRGRRNSLILFALLLGQTKETGPTSVSK